MAEKFSKSQLTVLRQCERRYLYAYQSWRLSEATRRECTFRGKTTSERSLVGQLTDDMITAMLRRYHRDGVFPTELESGTQKLLEQYVQSSEKWREAYDGGDPKTPDYRRQPIAEYVWEGAPADQKKSDIVAEVVRLLRTWLASSIVKDITGCSVSQWRLQGPGAKSAPAFPRGKYEIFAKYDFGIVDGTHCTLYDWKTGRLTAQSEASAREQLHIYALYAESVWRIPLENTALIAVWLSLGPENCRADVALDPKYAKQVGWMLTDTLEKIIAKLKPLKWKPEEELEQAFAMTDDLRVCQECPFVHCEGKKRLAKP